MTHKGNNILVPVDFEQQSDFALDYAINLAKIKKFKIILTLVREERSILSKVFDDEQEKMVSDALNTKLKDLADTTAKEHDLDVDYHMLKGSVHEEIVEFAAKNVSRLIVMGKGSRYLGTDSEKQLIGSTTSKVIRYAKTPVITVGSPYHSKGIRSIMLPLDLSKETRQKVNLAVYMAKLFDSCIKIVSVVESDYTAVDVDKIHKQAKQVEEFVSKQGSKCSSEIIKNSKDAKSMVPMLIKYSKDHEDIDLSLIMTHQENAVKQFFMGSTAGEFVRKTTFPVMTIVPKQIEEYYIA